MPTKEIKELRQAGNLQEALKLALASYEADVNNIWIKRSLSWVYYEYLKENNSSDKFEQFCRYLKSIVDLKLTDEDKMLFDNVGWIIMKMAYVILKENNNSLEKINSLLSLTKELYFTKPSNLYSALFQVFHKVYKESPTYIEMADWWGFDNFRAEDYSESILPNGQSVMSLAEQAYIAYAKQLLPKYVAPGVVVFDKEKASGFLTQLDKIEELHPEYQYPPYFKAKLLLALGDKENLLSVLLPFVKKKRNDFWAWELLGEAFDAEKDKKFACYCRGLLCTAPESMTINLREKLTPFFIERKMWQEAKTEIDKVVEIRQNNNWKISQQFAAYKETEWYQQVEKNKDNKLTYKNYAPAAEAILFSDIEEETIIIDFVNKEKKVLNFISSDNKVGFFKYDRFLRAVRIAELFKVRFIKRELSAACQVATVRRVEDADFQQRCTKDFQGSIRMKEGSNFGFLEDVFISPMLCSQYKLTNGRLAKGKAIKSFNDKKKDWGWKAYEIDKLD